MSINNKDCFRAVFSLNAEKKLQECVRDAKGLFEVGGVLLGHRDDNVFYITDATVPASKSRGDLVTFVLDGEEHSKSAQMLAERYFTEPHIIGIWHSHICDYRFSNQDRESNLVMARELGGTLSVLYTDCIKAFYIEANGGEYEVEAICDLSDNIIPGEYTVIK